MVKLEDIKVETRKNVEITVECDAAKLKEEADKLIYKAASMGFDVANPTFSY